MSAKEIFIVQDYQNNLWQFYLNEDGSFVYRIMYSESKWTKEKKLDSCVESFCIELDKENNFHVIYVTFNGELKYCVYKNQVWAGKTLYSFESSIFYIKEIGLKLINEDIHIVFILCRCGQTKKGKLIHYLWSGEVGASSNIFSIELIPFTERHFSLEVASESVLYVFFLSKESSEAAVMKCGYINSTWSEPQRLYGISGENIEISTLENDNEFNIMNISEENSLIVLERAFIDYKGSINCEKIYETKENVKSASFFIYNRSLFAQWLEGESIIKYACLGEKRGTPTFFEEENSSIQIYRYKSLQISEETLKTKIIFGTAYPDLKVHIPKFIHEKEFVKGQEELLGVEERSTCNEEAYFNKKNNGQEDKEFLKVLQKRVATLQMQLQLKERAIEDEIEKNNRVIEQRRIFEEKNTFFMKLQKETKLELDNAVTQLNEERKIVNELRSELHSLNDMILTFKEDLSTYKSDNKILKKELEELKIKNKSLVEELRDERNKSIFSKLLKKSD